jgi:hypothetical protein
MARHTGVGNIPDEDAAEKIKYELVKRAISGYHFTELDLTGEAVHGIKGPGKRTWYHYAITCSNLKFKKGKQAGKGLVLFTSTKGYATREEAQAALQENYLLILKYARTAKNYGTNEFISLKEILVHSDDPKDRDRSIVFVPAETQYEFDGIDVPHRLMALASGYPVWYLRKNKYRYVAGNVDLSTATFNIDWRSQTTFITAREAMLRFRFFLVLLNYAGNYYTEWNPTNCSHHIYIREVLAISAHGFSTAEEAWGFRGVEKFICTTQVNEGFHPYWNRIMCSHSYYIACGNTGLVHPCTYDSPEKRNEAIDRLYHASNFNFLDRIGQVTGDMIILNNVKNEPVAKISINRDKRLKLMPCEWLHKFVQAANDDGNYIKTAEGVRLIYRFREGNGEVIYPIAEPISATMDLKEWKDQLRKIICYFPVEERVIRCDTSETRKYFVRIKLPEFDRCSFDLAEDAPCVPQNKDNGCDEPCYVAWKSDCCFDTCCDALEFYARSFLLLGSYENYKPVYECSCGSYRIELHPQLSLKGQEEFEKRSRELAERIIIFCRPNRDPALNHPARTQSGLFCSSEIVAVNPQAYTSEMMACEAIERAKKLINSEGLHLVEHILLRSRCHEKEEDPNDPDCRDILKPCTAISESCHLKWLPGGETDVCTDDNNTCFTPGYDPYSFISTISLPAWPERFRSKENRSRIEKLLHREAPAHVLLRILWLGPRDLYRFEIYFRTWNEWLAGKICDPAFTDCGFLSFLFRKKFDSLSDCYNCLPCTCGNEQQQSCFEEEKDEPCPGFDLSGRLNELYCWFPAETPDPVN